MGRNAPESVWLDDLGLEVQLEQGEDGFLVVSCPALPGCYSQGRTREEAVENIRDAMAAWLEAQAVPDFEGMTSDPSDIEAWVQPSEIELYASTSTATPTDASLLRPA